MAAHASTTPLASGVTAAGAFACAQSGSAANATPDEMPVDAQCLVIDCFFTILLARLGALRKPCV
jgi:hypothetical protein